MKIEKTLFINSTHAKLINFTIKLDLFAAGRAVITCADVTPQKGQLVEINAGLGNGEIRRIFLGFIESVTEIKNGHYQLLTREFSALLNQRIALNLRHCTPAQVLTSISEKTAIEFVLPESPWSQQTNARFQHIGGGYGALDALLKLWNVKKGVWLQQNDGRVYVGELKNSVPGSRTINLTANLFQNHSITGGTLPLVPRLRPGVYIKFLNNLWIIHHIEISENTMRLNWSENPFSKKLTAVS